MPSSLLSWDARLSARAQAFAARSPVLRRAAIPLARSGDAWLWFVGIAIAAAVGGPRTYRVAAVVAVAILLTALVVKLGKTTVRRARPEGTWGGWYRRTDPHAFPSGHAARSGLLAVLAFTLGSPWLGVVVSVWALLVAYSRVALGVHWVSDVAAGLVLGAACGVAVTMVG